MKGEAAQLADVWRLGVDIIHKELLKIQALAKEQGDKPLPADKARALTDYVKSLTNSLRDVPGLDTERTLTDAEAEAIATDIARRRKARVQVLEEDAELPASKQATKITAVPRTG